MGILGSQNDKTGSGIGAAAGAIAGGILGDMISDDLEDRQTRIKTVVVEKEQPIHFQTNLTFYERTRERLDVETKGILNANCERNKKINSLHKLKSELMNLQFQNHITFNEYQALCSFIDSRIALI